MTTTEGKLYLINVVTLERLEIQFIPDELGYSRTADLAAIKIVGRNEPKYHYTGGSTSLPLELTFYAAEESRMDVIRKIKWLESLAMADAYDRQPSKVKIVFGNMFRDEIWCVKTVNPKFSLYNREKGLYQQATVTMEFALDIPKNNKWRDVKWS